MWLAATSPTPEASRGDATLEASIAEAPLAFEPNAGRTGESVEFIAHAVAGGSLFLRPDEAILSLPQDAGDDADRGQP